MGSANRQAAEGHRHQGRHPPLLTGGPGARLGAARAIREEMTNEKVNVTAVSHPDSIYAGAIGAALWGAYRHAKLNQLEAAAA